MAKLADNILKFLTAGGIKLTEQETTALAALSQDEVSAEIQNVFDRVTNDTTSEIAKAGAKAANLDKFDESLGGWADILGDDIKTIAAEKGVQKLDKIKAKISSKIEEARKAAANGETADVEKLRGQITALEVEQQKAKGELEAAVAAAKSEAASELFEYKMMSKLAGRKDILDTHRSEKALSKLVLPDIMEYVDKKGLKIVGKGLDIVKADTETPYLKDAKPVLVDDLIEEALGELKYRQNGGEVPPKTEVSVKTESGSDDSKITRISALRPERRV